MSSWDNPAVVGAIGVAVGGAATYIQGALAARAKTGEGLRDLRLAAYPAIWQETAVVSQHPPADVTWSDIKTLQLGCRRWYYATGGLFLSQRSQERYTELQKLLGARLVGRADLDQVDDPDYDTIAKACSDLRKSMTQDLATRRQRSFFWTIQTWCWHRTVKWRAARRKLAKGRAGSQRYPPKELRLATHETASEARHRRRPPAPL